MSYIGSMTNDSPIIVQSAAADISGDFLAAELTESGVKTATAGAAAIGIILPEQGETAKGERVNIQVKDICRWTSGAEIAAGELLASDANGKCVKASGGAFIVGMALEAANAANVPILVQIIKSGYATATTPTTPTE